MFGTILKQLRENASLSQEQLAEKAGLHRTYISLLERGKKSPTLEVFLRLCKALGISGSKVLARLEARRENR